MRLGLLGPAGTQNAALQKASQFLLDEVRVDRAVYLGLDSALDEAVGALATALVGGDGRDGHVWSRAAERCIDATPAEIDAFVAAERARDALRAFESMPPDGARVVEIVSGKVAVLIYDKAGLDEEDIVAASLLLFGKSKGPVFKQVGTRWFISPGSFDDGGVLVLEDSEDGVDCVFYDGNCRETRRERIVLARVAKIRVADATG